MCNKSIICGVLFAPRAITFYEGNNMLFALAKYVINRLIHSLFHIALVISPIFYRFFLSPRRLHTWRPKKTIEKREQVRRSNFN